MLQKIQDCLPRVWDGSQGLVLRVLGFRVENLGCRVQGFLGSGFRVKALGLLSCMV